jgi:hypothetical protein
MSDETINDVVISNASCHIQRRLSEFECLRPRARYSIEHHNESVVDSNFRQSLLSDLAFLTGQEQDHLPGHLPGERAVPTVVWSVIPDLLEGGYSPVKWLTKA